MKLCGMALLLLQRAICSGKLRFECLTGASRDVYDFAQLGKSRLPKRSWNLSVTGGNASGGINWAIEIPWVKLPKLNAILCIEMYMSFVKLLHVRVCVWVLWNPHTYNFLKSLYTITYHPSLKELITISNYITIWINYYPRKHKR